jgi:PTH1 family peptidyl-tRNA hydrolase
MRFVVGLGNPGERYRHTRHNAGFMVVDTLAGRLRAPGGEVQGQAWVSETRIGSEPVLLVKPLSFMNLSGIPVARLLEAREGSAADLIVVVDDVALDLGTIRVRERGSDGGHNGLRSLIEVLGTEAFARVRVGVGQGELPGDLADYVLSDFGAGEREAVAEAIALAADAIFCMVEEGPASTMSRFNVRRV